ncbi:1-acyl-sn-glycerol-3-phosphate acyltransferase, partial [Haliscomenobacter sp.]|uniref:1-acyl-sn-glycerol-3-phosphate acyltransferase n=1 Tax=Haliscomenobacter sp. TaxID=2717303 RepID=UPI00336520E5
MLYYLVRPIARLGTYLFFRKIYFANEERIPRDKPIILAINHPTGFLEPIIMAVLLSKPLHFLVRGDFFSKKFYGTLLRALHMIPIFRMRDTTGFSGVKSNFSTFEACYAGLKEGKIIMIFPEGRTVLEKRLRPLQRGLVRIAFGTLERYPEIEDLYVVPVGVNFTDGLQPRGEVMINFGEPLSMRSFYQTGANSEGDALLETLATEMAKNIVIVENPADDELAEGLFDLDRTERNPKIFPILDRDATYLWREKAIAARINTWSAETKNKTKDSVSAYFNALEQANINDKAISSSVGLGNWLFLVLGFLPAWLGRIFCFPPAYLACYIQVKRVRRLEYKLPVWAVVSWFS